MKRPTRNRQRKVARATELTPLEYMLSVMNDPTASESAATGWR
jgi:hypothetical protein